MVADSGNELTRIHLSEKIGSATPLHKVLVEGCSSLELLHVGLVAGAGQALLGNLEYHAWYVCVWRV